MTGPFAFVFEYRNRRYYFCGGEGEAYPLHPGEAEQIARQLTTVLALAVLGLLGWAACAFFLIVARSEVSDVTAPDWLLDSSLVYPMVIAYWLIAWLASGATWFGMSWRFAKREPEEGINPGYPNNILKFTKPLSVLVLGTFMLAFVAQGFGDICFVYRGIGHCEIVKITPA